MLRAGSGLRYYTLPASVERMRDAMSAALLEVDRAARREEREETVRLLNVAKEAILWWQEEHRCCSGATDEQLEQIAAAIRQRTER